MSKLYECLSRLQTINDNGDYSIGLAQDIESSKEEIKDLRRRNKILLERLHNSKQDNRTNRDRLRSSILKLMKNNRELWDKSFDHDLRDDYVKIQNKLHGINCLISDLVMYRDDISCCPGRFQRVVDELIKELDD